MAVVLTLNPFSFYPPTHGGSLRRFHMLQELAREHEVHAVVLEPRAHFAGPAGGYEFPAAVRVHSAADEPPPWDVFNCLPPRLATALRGRWLRRTLRGSVSGFFLTTHHLIRRVLTEQSVDVAFLPLEILSVGSMIRRLSPRTVLVLDSYNVEHVILEQRMSLETDPTKLASIGRALAATRQQEERLGVYVDTFIACSDDDRDQLIQLNGEQITGYTVPNGVDTATRPFVPLSNKLANHGVLFLGSLFYEPNHDGLLWFYREIWPRVRGESPGAVLTVIGNGSEFVSDQALRGDPSVRFLGRVQDVMPFHQAAALMVVPLRMGSGTRLKILEAMSAGTPVVSTTIGCGGIHVVDTQHLLIRDTPELFASGVCELLSNPQQADHLRTAARRLVEHKYDWKVVGRSLNTVVADLAEQGRRNDDLPKVAVKVRQPFSTGEG
jgi:glycosyltransferase involved in cell wall biosynthesis